MNLPDLTLFVKVLDMLKTPMNGWQKAFAGSVVYAVVMVPSGLVIYALAQLLK